MNMKKTLVSLAAASLIVTSAMAADKGVDVVTTGQAVVYYQTAEAGTGDLFDQANTSANVGIQLNLDADLKNGFTFGSQLSYLGTAGLEKNLVSNTQQVSATSSTWAGLDGDTTNELAVTQINVAKTVANTTVKIGRQELPKSLSPFAYSESWNVFKNTFDAIIAINSDIPDTTVVAAYVSGGTGMTLDSTSDLTPATQPLGVIGDVQVDGTAYMLTVANKSLPMTTLTASYYNVAQISADNNTTDANTTDRSGFEGASAIWLDAQIADKDLPMGLTVGLQGGSIMTESAAFADTTAFGAKVSLAPVDALTVAAAYTSVDGSDSKLNVAIKNFGTGIKSPLYTQMVANQNAISLDADTFMLQAAYNTGDYGTIIAQGTQTSAGASNLNGENDFTDLELVYKLNAGGVDFLAAYVTTKVKDAENDTNIVRLWARYNF
jgi:hypothetical protein